jgi:hypothetical protein
MSCSFLKKLFLVCALFCGFLANGQTTTQTVNLTLTDVIDIVFTSSGTNSGSTVTLAFSGLDNYANGVESAAQDLRVRSNKNFTVTAKANASAFSYSGSTSPAPSMPVSGTLLLKISSNGTGGGIAGSFSDYASLTSSNQSIITNGSRGSNQTFSIKYKGTPGFSYPAGDYTVSVIYTATQQ